MSALACVLVWVDNTIRCNFCLPSSKFSSTNAFVFAPLILLRACANVSSIDCIAVFFSSVVASWLALISDFLLSARLVKILMASCLLCAFALINLIAVIACAFTLSTWLSCVLSWIFWICSFNFWVTNCFAASFSSSVALPSLPINVFWLLASWVKLFIAVGFLITLGCTLLIVAILFVLDSFTSWVLCALLIFCIACANPALTLFVASCFSSSVASGVLLIWINCSWALSFISCLAFVLVWVDGWILFIFSNPLVLAPLTSLSVSLFVILDLASIFAFSTSFLASAFSSSVASLLPLMIVTCCSAFLSIAVFASVLIVVAGIMVAISFMPLSLALSTWLLVCAWLIFVIVLFLLISRSLLASSFSSSVASLLLLINSVCEINLVCNSWSASDFLVGLAWIVSNSWSPIFLCCSTSLSRLSWFIRFLTSSLLPFNLWIASCFSSSVALGVALIWRFKSSNFESNSTRADGFFATFAWILVIVSIASVFASDTCWFVCAWSTLLYPASLAIFNLSNAFCFSSSVASGVVLIVLLCSLYLLSILCLASDFLCASGITNSISWMPLDLACATPLLLCSFWIAVLASFDFWFANWIAASFSSVVAVWYVWIWLICCASFWSISFFAFDLTAVAGKTLAISFIPATLAFSTSLFEDKELILSNDFCFVAITKLLATSFSSSVALSLLLINCVCCVAFCSIAFLADSFSTTCALIRDKEVIASSLIVLTPWVVCSAFICAWTLANSALTLFIASCFSSLVASGVFWIWLICSFALFCTACLASDFTVVAGVIFSILFIPLVFASFTWSLVLLRWILSFASILASSILRFASWISSSVASFILWIFIFLSAALISISFLAFLLIDVSGVIAFMLCLLSLTIPSIWLFVVALSTLLITFCCDALTKLFATSFSSVVASSLFCIVCLCCWTISLIVVLASCFFLTLTCVFWIFWIPLVSAVSTFWFVCAWFMSLSAVSFACVNLVNASCFSSWVAWGVEFNSASFSWNFWFTWSLACCFLVKLVCILLILLIPIFKALSTFWLEAACVICSSAKFLASFKLWIAFCFSSIVPSLSVLIVLCLSFVLAINACLAWGFFWTLTLVWVIICSALLSSWSTSSLEFAWLIWVMPLVTACETALTASCFSSVVASGVWAIADFFSFPFCSNIVFVLFFLTALGWSWLIVFMPLFLASETCWVDCAWLIVAIAACLCASTWFNASSFSSVVAILFELICWFCAIALASTAARASSLIFVAGLIADMIPLPVVCAWSTSLLVVALVIFWFAVMTASLTLRSASAFSSVVALLFAWIKRFCSSALALIVAIAFCLFTGVNGTCCIVFVPLFCASVTSSLPCAVLIFWIASSFDLLTSAIASFLSSNVACVLLLISLIFEFALLVTAALASAFLVGFGTSVAINFVPLSLASFTVVSVSASPILAIASDECASTCLIASFCSSVVASWLLRISVFCWSALLFTTCRAFGFVTGCGVSLSRVCNPASLTLSTPSSVSSSSMLLEISFLWFSIWSTNVSFSSVVNSVLSYTASVISWALSLISLEALTRFISVVCNSCNKSSIWVWEYLWLKGVLFVSSSRTVWARSFNLLYLL